MCVAKDGRRNIVILSCPVWKKCGESERTRSDRVSAAASVSSTVISLGVLAEWLPGVKRSVNCVVRVCKLAHNLSCFQLLVVA